MYYYNHGGIKTEYEKDSNLNYIMYYYNSKGEKVEELIKNI